MKGFDLNKLIRPNILALSPYSSARDEFTEFNADFVFLDANENPFENGVNRYPDPQQRKIKTILASQKGVDDNQILIGNGSDEVLDLIFRAFAEPSLEEVIIMPPTYGMYKVLANVNNVNCIEVNLNPNFELNVQGILDAITDQVKLIFICSPNNPTSNAFRSKDIQQVLSEFKGIVVIDEAYIDFSNQHSWIAMLDLYPNLIVTQTMSKAYGMAGIRLGIAYASEGIISVLNKIKPPYNVNALTQERALRRLEKPIEVQTEIKRILTERTRVAKALNKLTFVEEVYPSSANFLLVKVDDANKRYDALISKGIVVRNRTNQPLCAQTLRFTIGTSLENDQLIKTLKELK